MNTKTYGFHNDEFQPRIQEIYDLKLEQYDLLEQSENTMGELESKKCLLAEFFNSSPPFSLKGDHGGFGFLSTMWELRI